MIDGYTVTAIGDEAFARASSNSSSYSVTLPEGIKTIGEKAFFRANISEINLPSTLQQIGSAAFYGCPCCQFKPTANHPYFAVIDEGLYSKVNKELIAYSLNMKAEINGERGASANHRYGHRCDQRHLDMCGLYCPAMLLSVQDKLTQQGSVFGTLMMVLHKHNSWLNCKQTLIVPIDKTPKNVYTMYKHGRCCSCRFS